MIDVPASAFWAVSVWFTETVWSASIVMLAVVPTYSSWGVLFVAQGISRKSWGHMRKDHTSVYHRTLNRVPYSNLTHLSCCSGENVFCADSWQCMTSRGKHCEPYFSGAMRSLWNTYRYSLLSESYDRCVCVLPFIRYALQMSGGPPLLSGFPEWRSVPTGTHQGQSIYACIYIDMEIYP